MLSYLMALPWAQSLRHKRAPEFTTTARLLSLQGGELVEELREATCHWALRLGGRQRGSGLAGPFLHFSPRLGSLHASPLPLFIFHHRERLRARLAEHHSTSLPRRTGGRTSARLAPRCLGTACSSRRRSPPSPWEHRPAVGRQQLLLDCPLSPSGGR